MLSIGEAAGMLGVATATLRRWEREGKIKPPLRTLGNHRRYRLEDIMSLYDSGKVRRRSNKKTVCYSRVSGADQKQDLIRQSDRLRQYAETEGLAGIEVIEDIGSGLNTRKKGLKRLLRMMMTLQIGTLILTHEDRLLRFGTDLVLQVCQYLSIEVIILDNHQTTLSDEEQLSQDVIKLMVVFCARLHGRRSHQNRMKRAA